MLEQEGGPLCSRGCCWDLASLRTRPEPSPGLVHPLCWKGHERSACPAAHMGKSRHAGAEVNESAVVTAGKHDHVLV